MATNTATEHDALQLRLAFTAVDLLCAEPNWLRGIVMRAEPGPVRDAVQARCERELSLLRVSPSTTEEHLFGGIDTAQTLATGKRVELDALLSRARGGALLLASAERLPVPLTHRLAQAIDTACLTDTHKNFPALVVFDESLADEQGVAHTALAERITMHVSVPVLPLARLQHALETPAKVEQSVSSSLQISPADVSLPDQILRDLTQLAMSLGIDSMHALNACLRVARAHAAVHDRRIITEDDAVFGVQLALAPRARSAADPAVQEQQANGDAPDDDNMDANDAAQEESHDEAPADDKDKETSTVAESTPPDDSGGIDSALEERLIEAAQAVLPAHLIDSLQRRKQHAARKTGIKVSSGKDRAVSVYGGTRGRPAGTRPVRGRQRACRLNVLDTLKAALPYQKLRQRPECSRLALRFSDLRVTRYRQSPRSTTVFVVDASGSAAMHRLAEAKGATQLMLSECYVRRDRVALITFNGNQASLVLPPTRSLTRARRALQSLPGGGSTPLAAGMQLAERLLWNLQQGGEFPVCVLMSDARGNVALDGSTSRPPARADAEQQAKRLASLGVRIVFVDTSPRPRAPAQELASLMHARYLPLPRSGIAALPDVVMGRA